MQKWAYLRYTMLKIQRPDSEREVLNVVFTSFVGSSRIPRYVSNTLHPRCPSADKRIRKLWYVYTMEY